MDPRPTGGRGAYAMFRSSLPFPLAESRKFDSKRFTITKETVKYKNIKRDPRVSVVVDDVLDHHSVIAKGKAAIQEQDIWDMTRKIVYKYYGQEEGDPYLEQLKKQNRVLIVFKPQKMQTWGPVPREATKP